MQHSQLLPLTKHDTAKAEQLVALGYPQVASLLPALLEWMQDLNWPVSQKLQPLLAGIGAPLAPHVRTILATNDETWKYSVLVGLVARSAELARQLEPDLVRLASQPTDAERQESLDQEAREILKSKGAGFKI